MKTQHTPGSWEAFKSDEGGWLVRQASTKELIISEEYEGSMVAFVSDKGRDEFDAKLCAAAPELLEALENLVGAVTIKSPDIQKNIDDAYKAIAKAKTSTL